MLTPTQLCKCLGDDLRLSLVCLLHGQGEVCVCDLVDAISAPLSTAALRQCGLVVARRQGDALPHQPGVARLGHGHPGFPGGAGQGTSGHPFSRDFLLSVSAVFKRHRPNR